MFDLTWANFLLTQAMVFVVTLDADGKVTE